MVHFAYIVRYRSSCGLHGSLGLCLWFTWFLSILFVVRMVVQCGSYGFQFLQSSSLSSHGFSLLDHCRLCVSRGSIVWFL